MGRVLNIFQRATNPLAVLAGLGYVYNISEAAAATSITGPITYATTTPCLLARVTAASGLTMIPLYLSLAQTGTVAGGAVSVLMSVDNANRYTSGGTEATYLNAKLNSGSNAPPTGFAMFSRTGSAITATNAEGVRVWGVTVGQDVSPAEGVSNELVWTPPAGPEILTASASLGASWLIDATAATTGVTLFWSAKVAVFPTTDL